MKRMSLVVALLFLIGNGCVLDHQSQTSIGESFTTDNHSSFPMGEVRVHSVEVQEVEIVLPDPPTPPSPVEVEPEPSDEELPPAPPGGY